MKFTLFYWNQCYIHMNQNQYNTISPACPCCCSAYMEEHETCWECPVCGAVVDKM